jgi:hypothetical protein
LVGCPERPQIALASWLTSICRSAARPMVCGVEVGEGEQLWIAAGGR